MIFSMLLTVWHTAALSQSLGVVGEVFPVAEMSFLDFIHFRLQQLIRNDSLDEINQGFQRQVAAHSDRPTPLNLPRAIKKRVHYFRPEILLDMDIKDALGKVIYPVGTKVNALSKLPHYAPCWLFLNADEIAEQRWVQKESLSCANPKIILTGGSIHEMEAFLNTVIYFDQAAVLTEKLGIRSLPARVTRNQDALQIEELAIKENGDVL